MSSDAYTGKLKHIFDRSAKKKPRQADSQPDLPPWDDEDNGGPSSLSAFQQHQVFFDLDSSFVDLSTIRIWLTICDDGHARCTDYAKFGFPPTWLIDVEDECIVSPTQIPGEGRYCALSYVWGQTRTSKLTTATRPAFRRPGAFSADSGVFLPKTIRHAIGLVKALGERYLWVDALCIVQDEGELSELGNMGAIYARAYLTIVAATGWDADEGLWGLRGISRPRHIAENFGDDLQKYIDPDSMIWSSRGWTLQEKEFSRRMIMFCDQTVIWKCLCLCMDESGAELATQSAHGTALAHVNLLLRSEEILPDADPFALFAELTHTIISPYNSRSFTHTSDLPRAFAGIAQALTQTAAPRTPFRQGFCWGLPVAHLPYALTWCAAEENLRPRDRALGFPSWSWMAWEGSVSSEREPNGRIGFETLWDQSSMCDWDIVYPPPSGLIPPPRPDADVATTLRFARRAAIYLSTGVCIFGAEDYRWVYKEPAEPRRQVGYLLAESPIRADLAPQGSMPGTLVVLYPDQVNELVQTPLRESMVFVGISMFHARYWDDAGLGEEGCPVVASTVATFVKALWVVGSDDGQGPEGSAVRVQRRGVAVVELDAWVMGLQDGCPTVLLE